MLFNIKTALFVALTFFVLYKHFSYISKEGSPNVRSSRIWFYLYSANFKRFILPLALRLICVFEVYYFFMGMYHTFYD